MKIKVHVTPNSKEAKVVKIGEAEYEIKIDEKPLDGRANKRLLEILSEYFDVHKSRITIISGAKSREKLLDVRLVREK